MYGEQSNCDDEGDVKFFSPPASPRRDRDQRQSVQSCGRPGSSDLQVEVQDVRDLPDGSVWVYFICGRCKANLSLCVEGAQSSDEDEPEPKKHRSRSPSPRGRQPHGRCGEWSRGGAGPGLGVILPN